ncbi:cinnamoyl-CoA reductase CAD2-like isoform X1 [Humulus lupulus]|uniref:cinnamoyl-CoA reductase CAD2-like isoform X1 n=1 Tax=Humulus lupulus TaxID=3486 RepID=UPI002B416C90|nr:cinnamoyl-CoA reductase CAD2-like isoform X1 [Humulus lupulus]
MEKMIGEGKVVCVTGASGYIASWLVKLLLQRGYTVKASIRDLSDGKKTEHLVSLDGAKERLQLFKANLLEEGSFDSVVDDCECVFHTASPVLLTVKNPQEELIEPALNGTLNVLRSCAKVASLKRVVLTSSMAAVLLSGTPSTPDMIVDETCFSNPIYCKNLKLWYVLSKTLAEEAAWKFAKENGIDLISLNPGCVIGPLLQPITLNLIVEMILNLTKEATFPNMIPYWVDVRDTAMAHIHAFEMASASGRYCLVGYNIHMSETANILRQLYPTLTISNECEAYPLVEGAQVSKVKALTLGVKFTPLEVTLRDTIESLKEKGFLKI